MNLSKGTLYKFETKICPVCKVMEPLLQDFIKDNPEVIVERVDPNNEMDLCEKYGVSSLPAFIFVEDESNEDIQMLSGLNDKKEFNKFTKQFLKTL